jgi:ubiquinol-cytochrome c reductase cytochrome c1 subunit
LQHLYFRSLVGTVLTEDEAKAEAEDLDVEDGPNDEGEMFDRPGKLTDPLPKPYANDEQARASNNNALPPELSLMVQARVDGENYMFSLLTGYKEPPAGLALSENMHYNPYFMGGQIGMAQALKEGIIDYEDGTDANISQMAKDVTTFLTWTASPEQDERKLMGWKAVFLFTLAAIPSLYWKRLKWSPIKTRQVRIRN